VYTNPSAPQMTADGTIYWIGLVDTDGFGGPDVEALFRTTDGTNASGEVVLSTGDPFDPETLANFVNYAYQVSEENDHIIANLELTGPVAPAIWVDDAIALAAGDATADDDLYDTFNIVSINNDGNYVVTGSTDGDPATNHVLVFNGDVAVREGDTIAGLEIVDGNGAGGPENTATIRFVALNNMNQIAYDFAYDSPAGFRESVFFACNTDDIGGSSVEVFSAGSHGIDIDDDEVSDYFIIDVYSSQPHDAINIGDDGFVYATVTLTDGRNAPFGAVIRVPVNCCGNGSVDGDEDCDDGNGKDNDACLSDCTMNTCGDGIVNDDDEDCDDGGVSETCDDDCTTAECGDGTLNMVAGEDCDDGNDIDGDGCSSQCLMDDGGSESGEGSGDTTDTMSPTTTMPSTTITASATGVSATTDDSDSDTDGDEGGGADSDDGCGCRSDAPASGWGWLLLGLVALRRRRS
jgi:MYXO-CTERM domain-containing protein